MTDLLHRTVLDIPVDEWHNYRPLEAIRERQSASRSQLSQRRRQAMRLAQRTAALLRKEFSAQRIVLFGSLSKRGEFTLWSDIDLAVWGIRPDRFYEAVALVTGLSSEFKIDLVDPEFCRPSVRHAIVHEGVDL